MTAKVILPGVLTLWMGKGHLHDVAADDVARPENANRAISITPNPIMVDESACIKYKEIGSAGSVMSASHRMSWRCLGSWFADYAQTGRAIVPISDFVTCLCLTSPLRLPRLLPRMLFEVCHK